MGDLEKLSDRQLRQRMVQYSPLNIPVTPTTRHVVITKLREYMTNQAENLALDQQFNQLRNTTSPKITSDIFCLPIESKLPGNMQALENKDSVLFTPRSVEESHSKYQFIPCLLITALMVFFFVILCVYMNFDPESFSVINERRTLYTLCDPNHKDAALEKPTYTCIEQHKVESALMILKLLVPELQKRAEQRYCEGLPQETTMSSKELMQYLHRLGLVSDHHETIVDLHNAEYLIQMNPHWKIKHVLSGTNELLQFDEVVQLRPFQENAFELANPLLPFCCTISRKMNEVLDSFGKAAMPCVGGVTVLVFAAFRYMQSRKNAHLYAVHYYTKLIIAELVRRATFPNSPSSVVVVNHLRDTVIPLDKHKQKLYAWKEAIRNLERNDGRIRFGVARYNGQLCKTMKWIAGVPEIYT